MEEQAVKIQRSSNLIKGFMALVVIVQAIQFYQTNMMDFGAISGAIGVLSLLRGLLLSAFLLAVPIKDWFKANIKYCKQSYRYFLLAFVLILVSSV
jgi:membrane protein CcdC involved in cytochrome C biogenesis